MERPETVRSSRGAKWLLGAFVLLAGTVADADEWGHLKGQVVVTGDLSEVRFLARKIDPQIKDAAVCGAMDLPDESVLVEPQGRGLANVFVYLKDPPARIHPGRRDPPADDALLMMQNCRYFPHAFVMRAGQALQIQLQEGEVVHAPHVYTMANPVPGLSPAIPVQRINLRHGERLPLPIKCGIHPWMRSTLLVVDHPYATVTDANGRFEINDLPTGEQTFRVWHERPGYLVREWKATIAGGKTLETPAIEVAAERLKER